MDSHSLLQGSSWPRDQTLVSSIACRFFTIWATRGAPVNLQKNYLNVFLGQLHLFIYCLLSFYFLKDFLFLIWSTYRINKVKIAIEGIWSEREVRKLNETRSYFGRWNAPKSSTELVKNGSPMKPLFPSSQRRKDTKFMVGIWWTQSIIWKVTYSVISTIWHSGKDKTMETVKKKKKSKVARSWGMKREWIVEAQWIFRAVTNSLWDYNDGYTWLYICPCL